MAMNGRGKCLEIGQVLRLREILKKWRKLASTRKAALSLASKLLFCLSCRFYNITDKTHVDVVRMKKSNKGNRRSLLAVPPDVPSGHLPVYVGHQCKKRFVIPVAYLNHPIFRALLEQAEEEFGYGQKGGLAIPCDELLFDHILCFVERQRIIDTQGFQASSPRLRREICWIMQPPGMKHKTSAVGSC